jgi:arsenate reductase
MAAALFNAMCDPARAQATSAGTAPAAHVHPEVLEIMQEIGIDLSHASPTRLTPELAARADRLVTMGCGDECPVVPGLRRMDWPLADPQGQPPEVVRMIRDQITDHVRELIAAEDWSLSDGGHDRA